MAHHYGAIAFAFAFACLLVGVPVDLVWLVKVSSVWKLVSAAPRCGNLSPGDAVGGAAVAGAVG